MRLTPPELKRGPVFHTSTSSDLPEVCPDSLKRPFLHMKKTSRNRFQTLPFTQHRPAEPNPHHPGCLLNQRRR
jgi:hypothetical protein